MEGVHTGLGICVSDLLLPKLLSPRALDEQKSSLESLQTSQQRISKIDEEVDRYPIRLIGNTLYNEDLQLRLMKEEFSKKLDEQMSENALRIEVQQHLLHSYFRLLVLH